MEEAYRRQLQQQLKDSSFEQSSDPDHQNHSRLSQSESMSELSHSDLL
jgi:hypothetical protein